MALDELVGRIAVVTGAGSGIGAALARALAAEGAELVLADVDAAGLEQTASAVRAEGRRTRVVPTDVSDADQVDALAATAFDEFGAVHLLFNNAGVHVGLLTWEATLADWRWVYGVNFWGVVNGIRAFVPRMLAGGEPGHVVNTASLAGLDVATSSAVYASSKFAVVALSECLERDLVHVGAPIGVSVLCPGHVQTQIGTSARNRSDRDDPDDRDLTGGLAERVAKGLCPDAVAATTLAAIRDGRFYIETDAGYDEFIERRIAALRTRRRSGGDASHDGE
jgi:NADP-dependent 3-hydroxy acid dehydrogenase YdfG